MGVSKLFVWGEGVWRELDVASGRVAGWRRRARFVFVRRGRLHVARRRAVLRALQALAAGRPGAAADGARLPHRSKSAVRASKLRREVCVPAPAPVPVPVPAPAPAPCSHHHCCAHYNGCNNNNNSSLVSREAQRMREAATQCTQHAITINVKPHAPPAPRAPRAPPARPDSSGDELVRTPARRPPPAAAVSALLTRRPGPRSRRPASTSSQRRGRTEPSVTKQSPTINVANGADDGQPGGGGGGPGVCKELIIPESDVAALRGFVQRTRASALQRFDTDDEYKRALFYAINPLVEIERCARLERLLRSQFAARLGLAPRRPAPSEDTDKENKEDQRTPTTSRERHERSAKSKAKQATTPRDATRVTRLGESARANRESGGAAAAGRGAAPAPPRAERLKPDVEAPVPATTNTHVISKRASGGGKEYSSLEDHAIVAWLSSGARASLVNGNRVWRELQEQYPRLAGRSRSWHSLRNRYLRYILPALGALRLPPADVTRLRAAAATGAIKKKNRPSPSAAPARARRNSMFKEVAVRGASSRRPPAAAPPSPPPPPPDDDDDDDSYKPTAGTSKDQGGSRSRRRSPRAPPRSPPRSPRYSEVTRRFAATHRAAADTSSPTSPRSSSSSSSSSSGSPARAPTRSRRLFNPNNVL